MVSTAIDTYLETLAGYIFDDDKLVTYKWLSKELGLHVNLAKQILWQFLKEHKKGKDVTATFTLIGYLTDGIYRVEVVEESNLPSAKEKYKKLQGEHLYSLQRALPDIESLALTEPGDHKYAAIICKEISPREEEELRLLRWGSRVIAEGKSAAKSTEFNSKSNSNEQIKSKIDKNKLNSIFGKINNKNNHGITSKATEPQVSDSTKETAGSRGKKRQGSENCEVFNSKRQKRKSEGESGSSDNEEGEEKENEFDPEVVMAPRGNTGKPSPPKYKIEGGKRKLRKIVDKTSVDGNGYFITKKEYVYETCSESEETPDPPKSDAPKPKANLNANRKQASLFNFFKKS